MNKPDWKILSVCLLIVFGISFVGSLFTAGNVDSSWYKENKPSFTPPDWIFGPVWTILYFLIALSLYIAWTKSGKKDKKKIVAVFGVNLAANTLWSYLFFGIRNPFLAFLDILLILITIFLMIFLAGRIDRKAGWMLVPYLLWVCFAAIINLAFVL